MADIGHLWTHPILLDGSCYVARYGPVPQTPLPHALAATIAWLRPTTELRLQG